MITQGKKVWGIFDNRANRFVSEDGLLIFDDHMVAMAALNSGYPTECFSVRVISEGVQGGPASPNHPNYETKDKLIGAVG